MKVRFLGGTNYIGRSCVLLEEDGQYLIIDAGLDVQGISKYPFPEIPEEAKDKVCGIFITHAHLDHIGAIPRIWEITRHPPVFMSYPTLEFAYPLLANADSVHYKQKGESLYVGGEIEDCLSSVQTISPGSSLEIGNFKVTPYLAGHILGAYYYVVEGKKSGQVVVVSGDISNVKQQLVCNCDLPSGIMADMVILESTYGNVPTFPSRAKVYEDFLSIVKCLIEEGKKILIPSFALGRAQEVLLLLETAMEQESIPRVPVLCSGMAMHISLLIEEKMKNEITGFATDRLKEKGKLFETTIFESSMLVLKDAFTSSTPCIIVASPGMLSGGVAGVLASMAVKDPSTAILFVGYADEETPAGQLKDGFLYLGKGRWIKPECTIAECRLSSHASGSALAEFALRAFPTGVAIVHGDREQRIALGGTLMKKTRTALPYDNWIFDLDNPAWVYLHTLGSLDIAYVKCLYKEGKIEDMNLFLDKVVWNSDQPAIRKEAKVTHEHAEKNEETTNEAVE